MNKYDIIVLGSGPGGYVTAIRASQLGLKTAIVEKESLGGVCLNWGCIPTKALLKSAEVFNYLKHAEDYGLTVSGADKDFDKVVARSRGVADGMSKGVQFLLKKNKVDVINGFGKIKPGKKVDVDGTEYSADHIIIATGARSRELPNLPQDGEKVIGYRKAMTLKKQPKSMIVVGSGAIGVEFAHFYNAMGTDVTIVEFVKTPKGEVILEADIVLSAVGIASNLENIGLEDVGIVTDKNKVIVNDWYQTNIPGYYAIGDLVPGPALAHVASAEGITCVEKIAGLHVEAIDYGNIPGCTYASPEIASVGMTEQQAKDAGFELKVGKFPFSASGKATTAGKTEGFVKVIFDAKYGEWLGCHMIGAGVTDMIAEAVLGRKLETTGHEVLKTIHPHPTMSEAVMEAVADAYGEVIHL